MFSGFAVAEIINEVITVTDQEKASYNSKQAVDVFHGINCNHGRCRIRTYGLLRVKQTL